MGPSSWQLWVQRMHLSIQSEFGQLQSAAIFTPHDPFSLGSSFSDICSDFFHKSLTEEDWYAQPFELSEKESLKHEAFTWDLVRGLFEDRQREEPPVENLVVGFHITKAGLQHALTSTQRKLRELVLIKKWLEDTYQIPPSVVGKNAGKNQSMVGLEDQITIERGHVVARTEEDGFIDPQVTSLICEETWNLFRKGRYKYLFFLFLLQACLCFLFLVQFLSPVSFSCSSFFLLFFF